MLGAGSLSSISSDGSDPASVCKEGGDPAHAGWGPLCPWPRALRGSVSVGLPVLSLISPPAHLITWRCNAPGPGAHPDSVPSPLSGSGNLLDFSKLVSLSLK